MRNFIQPGESLDLIAPEGGVVSGVGVLIGALFVVASTTAAEDETFAGWRTGVFELDAATHASTQAFSAGDVAYWNNTAKTVTATAAGNQPIGVVVEDKVSTADTAKVVLVPRLVAAGDAIADLALTAVTGVDGTGSNAASKSDVDARMTTINNKVNAIIAALEGAGIVVS